MVKKRKEIYSVTLSDADVVKVMGPYGLESESTNIPYLFIEQGQLRSKLEDTNTSIKLVKIRPNELMGRSKSVQELEIINPSLLRWEKFQPGEIELEPVKPKRIRLRSKEKHQEQLDEILTIGRKLFGSKDQQNFSLRQLARQCNMTVGNLYRYIESKRDLWYAIRNRDFLAMEPIFEEIVQNHRGSVKELLLKFSRAFLQFAREDYDRFKMMFSKHAPPSKVNPKTGDVSIGPYEEQTRGAKILDGLTKSIETATRSGEFTEKDSGKIMHLVIGFLEGNVLSGLDYQNLYKKEDCADYDEFIQKKFELLVDSL